MVMQHRLGVGMRGPHAI
jgi:hypothetical protein